MGADNRSVLRLLTLEELAAFGESVGRALTAPALVSLVGELGAGKTTLVQSIARGLGVTTPVTSPTFALIHEYQASAARVVHCDLYRLESAREVAALGLDDMLADPQTILLVEWPDRAGQLLDAPTLVLTLSHVPDDPSVRLCSEVWAS